MAESIRQEYDGERYSPQEQRELPGEVESNQALAELEQEQISDRSAWAQHHSRVEKGAGAVTSRMENAQPEAPGLATSGPEAMKLRLAKLAAEAEERDAQQGTGPPRSQSRPHTVDGAAPPQPSPLSTVQSRLAAKLPQEKQIENVPPAVSSAAVAKIPQLEGLSQSGGKQPPFAAQPPWLGFPRRGAQSRPASLRKGTPRPITPTRAHKLPSGVQYPNPGAARAPLQGSTRTHTPPGKRPMKSPRELIDQRRSLSPRPGTSDRVSRSPSPRAGSQEREAHTWGKRPSSPGRPATSGRIQRSSSPMSSPRQAQISQRPSQSGGQTSAGSKPGGNKSFIPHRRSQQAVGVMPGMAFPAAEATAAVQGPTTLRPTPCAVSPQRKENERPVNPPNFTSNVVHPVPNTTTFASGSHYLRR